MPQQNAEFWTQVVSTRQELMHQYADDPDITLIDIGYAPEGCQDTDPIVLRVHVTEHWFARNSEGRDAFQQAINGISVCVMQDDD